MRHIITYVIIFIVSFVFGYIFSTIRTNREVELYSERYIRAVSTIGECRKSVGTISEGLQGDAAQLSDIIERLREIAKEVENMERSLDSFDDNDNNGIDY